MGNPELEYLSLLVGVHWVVAPEELVFDNGFSVLGPETFGITLLGIFGVHGPYHFLPHFDGVFVLFSEEAVLIRLFFLETEYHDTALAAE